MPADTDPSQVAHNGVCEHCAAETVVPIAVTRLERHPWRLVWWCRVCGRQSRAWCPPEVVPLFVSWDRAGGSSLSMREVADMARVGLDDFNRAVEELGETGL